MFVYDTVEHSICTVISTSQGTKSATLISKPLKRGLHFFFVSVKFKDTYKVTFTF